jgi:hypothetical protein
VGDLPKRVRVCADGRRGTVHLIYYDRLHTGDSYDELQVKLDDGKCVRGPLNLFESIECDFCHAEIAEGTGVICDNCSLCAGCLEHAGDFCEPAEPAEAECSQST